MASQEYMDKMQIRQNYRNLWHTDLVRTIQRDPPYLTVTLSPKLCVFELPAFRVLVSDVFRVWGIRVGHVYPTCFGNERFITTCRGIHVVLVICHVAVGVEKANVLSFAFALRFSSALGTQWPLPDFCCKTNSTFKQQNGFMFCLQQIACIFSIVAMIVGSDEIQEASQLLSCLADMVYCTVCACMQTQHKIEMDKRDGMFGPQPMAVPPVQQMSRIDQPIPPAAGYPPPAYGQAYPPQAPGYTAPGYPPAAYPPAQNPPAGYPPPGYYR
ncbi:hypothetical protein QUC31_008954 [Theobroma cacao]